MKDMWTSSAYLVTQRTFRILLQAMSHPGRTYALPAEGRKPGWQLVLQTLLDPEVSFTVLGNDQPGWEKEIRQLTRCPASGVAQADFLIAPEGDSHGELGKAKRGTLEYPDTGATVIYLVESLKDQGGEEPVLILRGPGIQEAIAPVIQGLNRQEFLDLQEINREFPLGIDGIFIDRLNRIMCLPRSTQIEVR